MKTREQLITPYLIDKRILDLGNSWGDFKDLVAHTCKEYNGLDIEGNTTYTHDLNTPMNLKKTFDVIVAGELIEHIENSGIFLDNIHAHLAPDGIAFLTTPNATSFRFFFYALFGTEPAFEGHIKYFTKDSLTLLLGTRFIIEKIGFTVPTTNIANKNWIWRIKLSIERAIGTIVPRLSPNLYAVVKRK